MKKRTSDYIADQLVDEILSGRMKGGEFLRQEEISEAIGASRIPVREALQTLVEQGLAIRLATRHIAVANITDQHVREIYGMIGELEYKTLVDFCREEHNRKLVTELSCASDHMRIHRVAYTTAGNVYFGHLLKNAVECYVRFAVSKIRSEEKNSMNLYMEKMCKAVERQDEADVIENIEKYYQLLAELVIKERGKNI